MDSSIIVARWCQCALPWGHIGITWWIRMNLCIEYEWTCAFFGPLESTTQMANRQVQPFLHSSRQKVTILYNGCPFPKNFPYPWGSGPTFNTIPWAHPKPKWHLDQFRRFCTECPYTLQWDAPSPQNCTFSWRIWTPSNTWLLVCTHVLNLNGFSIGSSIFAWHTSVTDRPTDHANRLVTIGRIYVKLYCDADY